MIDRRAFLIHIATLLAALRPSSSVAASRRPQRVMVEGGRPLLTVVHGTDPSAMVDAAFSRLADLSDVIAGKRVVIKPNATASQPYPVTTDPEMLRALVRRLKDIQAAGITICDSSSFAGLANARVFAKLGYDALAREERVRALAVDSQVGSEYVRISNAGWRRNRFVMTDRVVNRADFVINVAVPKRHHVADFTCALKNCFGCTSGTFRMLAHTRDQNFFDDALVEFADAVRPDLTIVDARSLLTRHGPAFKEGASVIVPAGVMVVGEDMVAVDSWCGRLMERHDQTFEISHRLERQLAYASSLGLGDPDLAAARVIEVGA